MVAGGKQAAGQIQLFLLIKEVAHVPEFAGLLFQRGADFVVAVAKGRHCNAGQQVDVFLAVHVPKSRAFASDHSQGITAVRTAEQLLFCGFDGGKGL